MDQTPQGYVPSADNKRAPEHEQEEGDCQKAPREQCTHLKPT